MVSLAGIVTMVWGICFMFGYLDPYGHSCLWVLIVRLYIDFIGNLQKRWVLVVESSSDWGDLYEAS